MIKSQPRRSLRPRRVVQDPFPPLVGESTPEVETPNDADNANEQSEESAKATERQVQPPHPVGTTPSAEDVVSASATSLVAADLPVDKIIAPLVELPMRTVIINAPAISTPPKVDVSKAVDAEHETQLPNDDRLSAAVSCAGWLPDESFGHNGFLYRLIGLASGRRTLDHMHRINDSVVHQVLSALGIKPVIVRMASRLLHKIRRAVGSVSVTVANLAWLVHMLDIPEGRFSNEYCSESFRAWLYISVFSQGTDDQWHIDLDDLAHLVAHFPGRTLRDKEVVIGSGMALDAMYSAKDMEDAIAMTSRDDWAIRHQRQILESANEHFRVRLHEWTANEFCVALSMFTAAANASSKPILITSSFKWDKILQVACKRTATDDEADDEADDAPPPVAISGCAVTDNEGDDEADEKLHTSRGRNAKRQRAGGSSSFTLQ